MITKQNLDWLHESPSYRKCPKCKDGDLDTRIPRGFWVKTIFFWRPYKKYRCDKCHAEICLLE